MSSPYDVARQQGYSDEEIADYFSKQDPAFKKKYDLATKSGYEPSQIFQYYSQTKKPKESTLENVNRQAVRTGLRAAETVLGAPRALGEFGEMLVPEKLITKGAEKIGLGEPVKKGFEFAKKYAPYKLFPKSEQIRQVNDLLFGKASKPKNQWEEKADELTTDFVNLALPTPGGKLKLLKQGLTALGGNVAGQLVEHLGGSKKSKDLTKLGVFLLGSLTNPRSAENLKTELYKQAETRLPKDATISSTTLQNDLTLLENSLKEGGIPDSAKPALEKIADARNAMQGEQISITALDNLKKNINEVRTGLYKQMEGNKPGIKRAKRNLDSVSKAVNNTLRLYGKVNPEWDAFYKPANEVHGAIEESKRAREFLQRLIKKHAAHTLLPALGIAPFAPHAAGGALAGVATTAAATTGGVMTGEIIARIMKSPTLRKHYMKLINAGLKENTLVAEENIKKLKKETEKKEKD